MKRKRRDSILANVGKIDPLEVRVNRNGKMFFESVNAMANLNNLRLPDEYKRDTIICAYLCRDSDYPLLKTLGTEIERIIGDKDIHKLNDADFIDIFEKLWDMEEEEHEITFIPNIDHNFELPTVDNNELKKSQALEDFIEQAKEQGRQEEKMRIARYMLTQNIHDYVITEYTGLCLSAVMKLKEKI